MTGINTGSSRNHRLTRPESNVSGTFMVGFEGQRPVYQLIHPVGWRTLLPGRWCL